MYIPKISIIVPIYKAERYLRKCVDSILSQTFTDFELLLIDDGSPDQCGKICDEYALKDKRVKVFHKVNGGVSSARNLGLEKATGEYVAFVDADDWIDVNMYSILYNELIKNDLDIVLCDFYIYYNNDKIIISKSIDRKNDKNELMREFLMSFTSLWNVLVRRSLYIENKLSIPNNIVNCEDFWLLTRLFYYAKRISSIHIPLYYYNRENDYSILNNLDEKKTYSEYLSYIETIKFFESKKILDSFCREMSWRILKCKQDLVLESSKHGLFLQMYPQSHKYILSCPKSFCNNKIKILMWLLVHKLRFVVNVIISLRKRVRI